MLEFLAYPVSVIMKFWHRILGVVLDPDSGVTWTLTILLLMVTVRGLIVRSAWRQLLTFRKMQLITPEALELRLKHADDPEALARAVRELRREHGVSVASGCLPIFVQVPVFIGLYQVLFRFTHGGMNIDEASSMSNGVFTASEVSSFLHAEILDVPLSAFLTMPAGFISAFPGLTHREIAYLALPMFIFAGVMTRLNFKVSLGRSDQMAATLAEARGEPVRKPRAEMTRGEKFTAFSRRMLGFFSVVFPFFPLFGALLLRFPVAIGIYWMLNSLWTYSQNVAFQNRFDKVAPLSAIAAAAVRTKELQASIARYAEEKERAENASVAGGDAAGGDAASLDAGATTVRADPGHPGAPGSTGAPEGPDAAPAPGESVASPGNMAAAEAVALLRDRDAGGMRAVAPTAGTADAAGPTVPADVPGPRRRINAWDGSGVVPVAGAVVATGVAVVALTSATAVVRAVRSARRKRR